MRTMLALALLTLLISPAQAILVPQDDYSMLCADAKDPSICRTSIQKHDEAIKHYYEDQLARIQWQKAESDYITEQLKAGRPWSTIEKEVQNKFHGHD